MKKIVYTFILSFGLLYSVSGQNSGYMGNRFIFNVDGIFSPSWRVPNFWGKQAYYAFNYILSPGLEVIVGKKTSVGANYQYFTTKFGQFSSYFYDNYGNYGIYSSLGDLKTHGFGLFFKQYLGRTRAPMGQYIRGEFNGFFYNYAIPVDLYSHNGQYYSIVRTESKDKGMLFGMKCEYGKSFVLLNRLVLSTGISVGVTFGGFKIGFSDGSINSDVKNRILRMYWVGFRLGVGFIAF